MALVCVNDGYKDNFKKTIINSEHVCKINKHEYGQYIVYFTSGDAVYINQHDARNVLKALGYDNNGIDFYMGFLDS